jgi:hypothetical protein
MCIWQMNTSLLSISADFGAGDKTQGLSYTSRPLSVFNSASSPTLPQNATSAAEPYYI